MTYKSIMLAAALLASAPALAQQYKQNLNPVDGDSQLAPGVTEDSRFLPGDKAIPTISPEQIQAARKAFLEFRMAGQPQAEQPKTGVHPGPVTNAESLEEIQATPRPRHKVRRPTPVEQPAVEPPNNGPPDTAVETVRYQEGDRAVTVFASNLRHIKPGTITLPSGSSAFATTMFGQNVGISRPELVTARLDYAFLGPNQSVVELRDCMVFIELRPNFSISKVVGRPTDLTCRSRSGSVFTIPFDGLIVDSGDEYAGADGSLQMNGYIQSSLLQFVQAFQKGYGEALQQVEKTTSTAMTDFQSQTFENVTGSKNRYIAGRVLESTASFLDRIINFYSAMEPTLAVAPGTTIHIVNRHNLQIPIEFFRSADHE